MNSHNYVISKVSLVTIRKREMEKRKEKNNRHTMCVCRSRHFRCTLIYIHVIGFWVWYLSIKWFSHAHIHTCILGYKHTYMHSFVVCIAYYLHMRYTLHIYRILTRHKQKECHATKPCIPYTCTRIEHGECKRERERDRPKQKASKHAIRGRKSTMHITNDER